MKRVEIKFCNVPVSVDMMKIEFWNSDESSSKVYYEPWDVKAYIKLQDTLIESRKKDI